MSRPAPQTLPLSQAQQEVWLDQRAWPASPHLWVGGTTMLRGRIELPRLQQALHQLAAEQLALRLVPQPSREEQLLLPVYEPVLRELPATPGLPPEEALHQAWIAATAQPCPLGSAPPWRVDLMRFPEHPELLGILLLSHHLIMDGAATAQFLRRWGELYSALVHGEAAPPADGEVYREQIEGSASYRQGPQWAADAAFWRSELPEAPPVLLPRRQQDATSPLPPAALLHHALLPRSQYAAWGAAAAPVAQTEFALVAAALALYFARVQGLSEVVIGVPALNRSGRAHRAAIGMYVGVLPLRIPVDAAQTGLELMATVGRQLRRAMRHARYPISALARELQLMRAGRDAPFDLLLSFERQDYDLRYGAAQLVAARQRFAGFARYPLSLTVCDFGASRDIELVFEGSRAHLEPRELDLLARRLRGLLERLAAEPQRPVGELPLLDAAEWRALIEGPHRDLASLDPAPSFIQRFCEQAALHPLSLALVWDGGALRFGELAAQVRQLAGALVRQGVQPGDRVALALPRSPELVLALLAVARAGAAFLPLDPDCPDARLEQILEDAGVRLLIAPAEPRWARFGVPVLHLPARGDDAHLPPLPQEGQLAYVLFTSGSSGWPKGVAVSHGALARRLGWLSRVWDITPADRSLQGTQSGFDPALIELLLPLIHGGSVALPPPGRQAPETWAAFAARHGCTLSALVPTTLQRLLDGLEALPEAERARIKLRVACCGGEVLAPALAERWLRLTRAQLWNVYGPTEACIFASAWACRPDDPAPVLPIGAPVDDTRLYVLDAQRQPLPFGAVGELWIGGRTLAEGYLHRPELDAAAFAPDPFVPGGRMYRSGDRAWWDGEGRLQFAGRADRQVKLRGYRIELAEVETALLSLPGVREACVQPVEVGGRRALQAWLSPADLDLHTLQLGLRTALPDYMQPTHWSLLPALPLLPGSAKVDLKALPQAEAPRAHHHRAPASPLEQALLELMRQALQDPELGLDDDFFEYGGDSLAALDLLLAIEKRTGLHPTLQMLAQAPSVAALAQALMLAGDPALRAAAAPSETQLALALSHADEPEADTLYLAASGHGDLLRFQTLAQALAPQLNVQMLQPPRQLPLHSMADLAEAYAQHIAAQAGGRPVRLAGFSVGGVAALETARRLRELGVAVQSVVLIDSVFPRWLFRQGWLWKAMGWATRRLWLQELTMNGRRLGAMFNDAGLVGQVLALKDYRLAPYPGEVLLIRTSGLARWQRWLFGPWQRSLSGSLRVQEVEGLHGSIFEPGRVGGLAQCLLRALPPPAA
ncbi:non-ribosomal peptide synthetase [Inhella proteolytica]|uniref:Amino acid adenylation domain-containing protein n=1 Tax=Inhella proteolytica TaxID=2795029 RepID=A0A931NGS5_9BURK|nr:non-ribosomal peptide synthetase [Inhella proteolytica]MBH9576379.1 amino acid adenylation domain-containing protein [Inhella proteolytica]